MEESLKTLTILYTARLNGDLDLLPRLYTFLRRLSVEFAADTILRFDLGGSCDAKVWHCEATDGRSMLIALDGMGYDAANVSGYLTEEGRAKLTGLGELVRLTPHEPDQPFEFEGLRIDLIPAEAAMLQGGRLSLAAVMTGEVGAAHLVREWEGWRLVSVGTFILSPGTLPDPTIAGLVEFITAEARYAQKKRAER